MGNRKKRTVVDGIQSGLLVNCLLRWGFCPGLLFAFADTIEVRSAKPLLKLLKDFGGWPVLEDNEGGFWNESDYNFESLVGRLIGTLGINGNIMSSGVIIDESNTSMKIIYVSNLALFYWRYFL